MKITALTLGFLLLTNFCFSQIKKKELDGEWYSDNDFGQYHKNDTIRFTSRIKNPKQEKRDCEQIKWEKENRTFKLTEVNICTARAKATKGFSTQKIKLRKTDFGQTIEYYQDKKIADKFRIIELNKDVKSEFKLMRFDKLSEQKVYKYVDSLVFKVLNYNPDSTDSNYGVKISDSNPNVKIKIRDGGIGNPEPLIVVNGRPLKNREPLKELLLVETYTIKYLTKEESASIYGSRAINGVVLLLTSEKRFKKIWKKYGR
ncbi:hypothetical protein NBRC110019_30180 [Neptunitalea chrysea]|uniref:TonB-dependent receptor plug domain-containing protein n=1 Tax=Neptunitalea chrysea TaxID=1647581 RepID=A0A9W6EWJ2_9FLAO|nr:hypothetical protein [Neptunitalea chrysea]GLB53977.1 hypothetical protein NBRC110019_30180 [Neptunitalea chrysea]